MIRLPRLWFLPGDLWPLLIALAIPLMLRQVFSPPPAIPFFHLFGPRLTLTIDAPANQTLDPTTLDSIRAVVQRRLDLLALAGPSRLRVRGQQLVIDLPRHSDEQRIGRTLTTIGRLELIDTGTEFARVGTIVETSQASEVRPPVYTTLLTNDDVAATQLSLTPAGAAELVLTLTPEAASRYATHTAGRAGLYLCITLDKEVIACPIVRPAADGLSLHLSEGPAQGLIDIQSLAAPLGSGLLPMPLRIETG